MLKIAIICGGPSEERGISLNSARSFLDHTRFFSIEILPFYLNPEGEFYQITEAELYSNTPSDFDFKLKRDFSPFDEEELIERLRDVDLVFPIIHGIYGEDGTLQKLLERRNIPFVGSSSEVCRLVFDKHRVKEYLKERGYPVFPALYLSTGREDIEIFWEKEKIDSAIVKPTKSGSSIGVTHVTLIKEAKEAVDALFERGFSELLLEPYCTDREFTICVVENRDGIPVAMVPLEIEVRSEGSGVLDYRKKYLPSDEIRYHCPPRFSGGEIETIRKTAEGAFSDLGLRDFARIDGWLSKEGEVHLSDFNPISGMEQNSFLFQQAAQIGLSHGEFFAYLLKNVLNRLGKGGLLRKGEKEIEKRERIYVLMGGGTAERQVSLMSGTNVWLKLLQESSYESIPFLLDRKGRVWEIPYAYTLHHTVDEIEELCDKDIHTFFPIALVNGIRKNLDLLPLKKIETAQLLSLEEFVQKAKGEEAFIFIALHGGMGENGTLQKILEEEGLLFNGSDAKTSALCMDKHQTAHCIEELNREDILSMPQIAFDLTLLKTGEEKVLWKGAVSRFQTEDLLIKPQCDGCSAGVARIVSYNDFQKYLSHLREGVRKIPEGTLSCQETLIEMPISEHLFLLEPFIHTDKISIEGTSLSYKRVSGWCEVTIAILERGGEYEALDPSITDAQSHTLSLEEKFQGGTGVNLTPPPEEVMTKKVLKKVQMSACIVAKALGIRNYARLDFFVECSTGRIRVIEANTLPALTPSTVFYQQAMNRSAPLHPKELLSRFIQSAKENLVKTHR